MKKLFLILSVVLFSITLASCHGRKYVPLFEIPEEFDTSREYNITFWAKNDTNIVQKTIYENTIKEFEKIYPNIHVEIVQYTDYTLIYEDVLKNIATNTTPNVCITYPDYVATYLQGSGVMAPLTELMEDEKYGLGGSEIRFDSVKKDEIIGKFLDECIIQNEYYLLPFVRSSEAMYVNKTYLIENGFEIPEVFTWDYVWEICEYAEQKSQREGTLMYPLIYKSTDNMFIQLCKQNNYDYTNLYGEALFLSDEVKGMLLDLSDHIQAGHFETFKRKSYPGNYFNKGQCIFAIDSTAGATWMGPQAPLVDIKPEELSDFEPIVTTIPQVDPNNKVMISQGPSLCIFNKEDDHEVLASWIFTQYLLTKDVQLAYSQTEGYLPVTTEAIESEEFLNYLNDPTEYNIKLAATKLVLDNIDNTFVTPVYYGSSLSRSASGYLIEAMFNKQYQSSKGIDNLYGIVEQRFNLSYYEK